MINQHHSVRVFAPATSANVGVGFDIMGFALEHLGDEITLIRTSDQELKITAVSANYRIPWDVQSNTATVALQSMLDYLNLKQGFQVQIKKNIPLSSGLGGSAASSVAALVALNRFLTHPLPQEQLIDFALSGEQAACGARHGDNVIPCLFGGMTLIQSLVPLHIIHLPVLPMYVVLVHPHLQLDTRESRAALSKNISLELVIKQNAHLATFISALYEKDYDRLAMACIDELIEPMRAHLIPGFYEVKAAAYQYGALACSISGSGPTLFAFANTRKKAEVIGRHMSHVFLNKGIQSDLIISAISLKGARVLDEE